MGIANRRERAVTVTTPNLPPLRRQKEKGRADRAFVVLDGKRIACGRWGTDEAQQRYDRLISEWLASGRRLPVDESEQVTVAVLVDRYWDHVQRYYVKPDGTPTWEQRNIRQAVQPLTRLYADLAVADFGPRQLKAVRQAMLDRGWARTWTNRSIDRIRRAFRWGVGQELVPAGVYDALRAVEGLKAGRSEAREPEPKQPVSDETVEATLPHLTPTLRAMVKVQRLTGMRPGEVCKLTTGMIDVSGEVWIATFGDHKSAHRGKVRQVFIGPQAQDWLKPYLKTEPDKPVFSPAQSERERREHLSEQRRTYQSCGNKPGTNRTSKPRKAPRQQYDTATYAQAIAYACDAAFPPPDHLQRRRVEASGRKAKRWETNGEWSTRLKREGFADELDQWRKGHRWTPGQLRHSYATEVRKNHGLEAAQVLLGHSRADVTQVYAERDVNRALQVARDVG
jgi:integrase